MRIALTANGPGEVAGWVRPLLRALYARDPGAQVSVFLVPDDFATGTEAATLRAMFPAARVYPPATYLRFALGRPIDDPPDRVDVVQYLGGDLLHAVRLHGRLGGRAATYKFARAGYRKVFARAFAIDPANVAQLRRWRIPAERIELIGNLAIDGALLEAGAEPEPGAPRDGVVIMPGSRPYEVDNLVPLFFTAALQLARERPEIPVAFGISPFTSTERLRAAIERGGDPRVFARRGRLVHDAGGAAAFESLDGSVRIPILRNALAAAARARLVATIPGTKCIELAALGKPMIAITPLNAPEKVAFNGPLTYLDRVPLIGIPLKRAAAVAVARRFRYHTQPNIDAQAMVIAELHGTMTPGRVARVIQERFDDAQWIATSGERLRSMYREHVGAAERMAASLLALAG